MKSTNRAGPPRARAEDDPTRTFFRGLEQAFDDAWGRGEGCRRAIRIGSVTVALRFTETRLAQLVMRCLGHIEVEPRGRADATVDCVIAAPVALPWARDECAGDGEDRALLGGRIWVTHDPASGRIEAVDPSGRRAIAVLPDPEALAPHELASPLRACLLRLVDRPGVRFLHAGAVVGGGGAALLVGSSGSGKSTLALACLDAGLGYLGDDYVAIDQGGRHGAAVYSVYTSAKLDAGALDRLGDAFSDAAIKAAPGPKQALCLRGRRVLTRAGLAAIVVPSIGGDQTRLDSVSPARALLAMAPSTMIQHPGRDAGALTEMRDLVTSTPCWRLAMDNDLVAAATAVGELLG